FPACGRWRGERKKPGKPGFSKISHLRHKFTAAERPAPAPATLRQRFTGPAGTCPAPVKRKTRRRGSVLVVGERALVDEAREVRQVAEVVARQPFLLDVLDDLVQGADELAEILL